jgi:hypothetical protein
MQLNYFYKLYKKSKMVITISYEYCQIIIYKMLIFFEALSDTNSNASKSPYIKMLSEVRER